MKKLRVKIMTLQKAICNKLNTRKPTRPVIVDTNLLLDLFGGNNKYGYDNFWDYALENNIKLYITPITITEYINRRCRFAYNYYLDILYKRADSGEQLSDEDYNYKTGFQKTSEYSSIFEDSIKQIKLILSQVNVVNIEQSDLLTLEPTKYNLKDYNDAMYYHLAIKNNWGIVTHDRDFLESPSPLIIYTNLN